MQETTPHPLLPAQTPDALLRLVADAVPALLAYYRIDTLTCLFANQRYAEYNGWTTDSIRGKTVREAIGEQAWHTIEPHVRTVQGGQPVRYVRDQHLPDGKKRIIDVSLTPHFAEGGQQVGAFVLINDITEQWRAEQAVRDSETRMRKFAEATSEGIAFHKNGVITDVNSALLDLTGYSAPEMLGRQTIDFVPEDCRAEVVEHIRSLDETPYESAILHKDGHTVAVEYAPKSLPYEGQIHRVVAVRDITARKQAQQRIEFLALHDPLTQLPNRQYLNEFLPRTLRLAKRQGVSTALLFIDLDGFKSVNDRFGHLAGDQLLCETARRLRSTVRESDLVVRLGGDEFLVVLCQIERASDAVQVAENLLSSMQPPVLVDDKAVSVLPSIGISLYPKHAGSVDDLISQADTAMYRAKDGGGNRYHLYGTCA
jgi:diguanylate cyclase (GGDEF)-like protein/PAS domain S-box-containing protein